MRRSASIWFSLMIAAAVTWGSNLTSRSLSEGRMSLPGHEGPVPAVAYAPDGLTLLSAGRDRTVRLWDAAVVETAGPAWSAKTHTDAVFAAVFAPDGKTFATGGFDKTVILWDASTRKPRARAQLRPSSVFALAYSGDGAALAAGGDQGMVYVLDPKTGGKLYALRHGRPIRALAFSKDRVLASCDDEGGITLWSPGRSIREPQSRIKGHEGGVTAAAFSPDGKILATAGADRAIRLWSVPDGRALFIFRGHLEPPTSLAFFPDGQTLASGGPDKARFWDVDTGIEKTLIEAPNDGALSISISPDGTTLASGNKDGTVRLYLLNGADERRALSAPPPRPRRASRRI